MESILVITGLCLLIIPYIQLRNFTKSNQMEKLNKLGTYNENQLNDLKKESPAEYYYFKTYNKKKLNWFFGGIIGLVLIYTQTKEIIQNEEFSFALNIFLIGGWLIFSLISSVKSKY